MGFYSVLWDVGRLPGETQNRVEGSWKTGSNGTNFSDTKCEDTPAI